MGDDKWVVVYQVSGSLKAELLKGLLAAQGITVVLSQEGVGESIYPVTVGPLSEIQLLVASHQVGEANKILSEYESGSFDNPDAYHQFTEPKKDSSET